MTDSQGLMNIGKHCAYCRQLDFLPFTCSDCGSVFCGDHRMPSSHQCSKILVKTKSDSATKASNGPSAASLFAAAKEPKSYEINRNQTLNDLLLKDDKNGRSLGGLKALEKVRKFVSQQRKLIGKNATKGSNSGTSFKSFFKTSPSERIVSLSKLKSSAKGDSKVSVSERVYAWVIVVPDGDDFADFFVKQKQHLTADFKKPVYVSRSWPVGRALDSIAQIYKIKNENNKVNDKKFRLSLFRLARNDDAKEKGKLASDEEAVIPVPANGRVNKEIKDGDTLYLIRGAEA